MKSSWKAPIYGSLLIVGLLAGPNAGLAQSSDIVLTPRTFVEVSKRVLPAVVSISVEVPPSEEFLEKNGVTSMEDLIEKWMESPNQPPPESLFHDFQADDFGWSGAGSGVVVRVKDGWAYALTNGHVLEKNERTIYTVALDSSYNGEDAVTVKGADVELVGTDSLTDLAVLRFKVPEGKKVASVDFGDSDKLEVGEWVLALGNPLELNNSVSQGIISAKNRVIRKTPIEDLLQTTAVINPGNSGGPLVNLEGDIVGINNAIATSTGRWAGVGFAIPGNQAKRVADMLIEEGKVSRGYLGVSMSNISPSLSRAFDLKNKDGVLIDDVRPETPAAEAGLEIGDIVTRINGTKVHNPGEMLKIIGQMFPGDQVSMDVMRLDGDDREDLDISLKLAERPDETVLNEMPTQREMPSLHQMDALELLGLGVEPIDSGDEKGLAIVQVTPNSAAARAGLQVGDIIVQINGVEVEAEEDAITGLSEVRRDKDHVILYRRDGHNQFITVPQEKQ